MSKILNMILRAGEGRILKKLQSLARQVDELEDTFREFSDDDLKAMTNELKERHADGETLDELLPEAFAAVREAASRTLGQRHYTVQVMGGAALHLGNIAEMKTGEGKTLVATLPAYLNALSGKGVHVITVNDYLASYQSELMGRVFRFLGMTTGCITSGMTPAQRREQYAADITYGTNNEFGFDYLRDNMAWKVDELVQRGHNFAIIDEVDSILIDEARTPLIISGPSDGDANKWYQEFARVVTKLRKDLDYEVDEKKRTVGVLEPGIDKIEDQLGIDNLYETANTPLVGYINNAIKAKELFKRDKDYIVLDGEVLIVDEHTGRVLPGRRYNEGMHQAIEAKEGVKIKAENQTLATITLQNYFRLYNKISGMTGTAETEAEEFANTYDIGVVPIPTNKPMIRKDQTDLVYPTVKAKYTAIVEDIARRYEAGQPVLVGTTSVERSEEISQMLDAKRVPHEVLNAKQHKREAAVVAMAGRKGAVTVATNMAGRGTDIMLGGNAEFIAVKEMEERGLDPAEQPEEYEAEWPGVLEQAKETVAKEHDEVVELGGLYVLGSERHESRRIDNQLRGRSGRQGDPGESRFYLSLEDDLLRLFATGLAARALNPALYDTDEPLEMKILGKSIATAQGTIESRNAEIRKNVLKYDDVMSDQRAAVYNERREILYGEDLADQIQSFLSQVVSDVVGAHTMEPDPGAWDLDHLWRDMKTIYRPSFTADDLIDDVGGINLLTAQRLHDEFDQDIHAQYEEREEEFGEEQMREIERRVLLTVLDRKWREHLYEMDYLKEGIGLRAMAQRNPLVEYKREGYDMFQAMSVSIKEETVRYLFALQLPSEKAEAEAKAAEEAKKVEAVPAAAPAHAGDTMSAEERRELARKQEAADKVLSIKRPKSLISTNREEGQQAAKQARPAAGGMNRAQRRAAKKKKRR